MLIGGVPGRFTQPRFPKAITRFYRITALPILFYVRGA